MMPQIWPSNKANHSCDMPCKLLYVIQIKILILALLDIKVFGCLAITITMLLLIGYTLCNSQAVFLQA